MEIRRTHLDEVHAEFVREETRDRHFELAIREEENTPSRERIAVARHGAVRALHRCACHVFERNGRNAVAFRHRFQPAEHALRAEREGRLDALRTALLQLHRRIGEEGLHEDIARRRTNGRHFMRASRRKESDLLDPHAGKQAAKLIFHRIGQNADDHERISARRRFRQRGHQSCKAGILALREGGLDARAGIIQHAHGRMKLLREAARGAGQIELDHLRRAGAHQEQQLDIRAALQKPHHHAVEFLIRIRQPCEIAIVDDRGRKARFGEDHHAGGGLHEMRAGARADDQEEGILDLPVQPHDSGEATEHLALAALAQDRRVCAAGGGGRGIRERERIDVSTNHDSTSKPSEVSSGSRAACRRAARSFSRNCAALIT